MIVLSSYHSCQIDTAGVSAWFGYDSVGHGDGNWRLSSSNAVSPFANWGVGGVPSTAGQACAMLASGSTNFIDADCAGVFNSICEFCKCMYNRKIAQHSVLAIVSFKGMVFVRTSGGLIILFAYFR